MDIDRRGVISLSLATLGAASLGRGAHAQSARSAARPQSLRVCGVAEPLALGDRTPRFAWTPPGQQTAYRITTARSASDLVRGGNLIWDSGWVESDQFADVRYGGGALPPRSAAVWRVECRVVGRRKPVASAVQRFETGLVRNADWQAGWIASECETARLDRMAGMHWVAGKDKPALDEPRYFRWTFDAQEAGAAEFLLSIHMTDGVWLNGESLTAQQDDPVAWTTMAVYPVNLRRGRNVFAVKATQRRTIGPPPPLALAALLRHGTGLQNRTNSASGWKTSAAAPDSWMAADYDDAAWQTTQAAVDKPVGEPWPTYPAMYLRRAFSLPAGVRSARLYATACGVYEASLNGQRIGDARLTPELTDAGRRLLYQAYDVTALLARGDNVLAFEVADGWYGSEFTLQSRFAFGGAPCRLLAQLEIELADGARMVIGTDGQWKTATSAVLSSEIYDGEVHDARLEQPGWNRVGFDDSAWAIAPAINAPKAAIEPQISAPIAAMQARLPVDVKQLASGDHVIDFGQNFAGWVKLSVKGERGRTIDIRYAEMMAVDGSVDQSNLRSAWSRNRYILAGRERETFEPRFTYHGFRYVQISGLPDDRNDWTVEGIVAHQRLEVTGDLRVGDPVIHKFWTNSVWSQRSNFFGMPTDCPQRDERLGWMGDAQVFWDAAAYNMDLQAYTGRFLEDVRYAQTPDGGFTDCIPPFLVGWETSSPGWADAGVVLPYVAWRHYGDTQIIERHWAAMERYLGWIAGNNPNHLWKNKRGADWGDWLAVDAVQPGDPTTPKDLIGTAFWAYDASLMAQMATATGNSEAAVRYARLFETVKAAFQAEYVRPDGAVGNESQTGYVLAIRFGLLPDALIQEAGRRLSADITRRGGKLSTGFLGTPHILDALAMTGQEQAAISLLLQRDKPSWGYMVMKGATTMWERWNSDEGDTSMNSRNHYAFGAIGSFMFRRIAGIDAVEPGFRKLRIAPIFDARLKNGGASYRTAAGTIRTDWVANGDRAELMVDLPPNTQAEVILPGQAVQNIGPGSHRFTAPLLKA